MRTLGVCILEHITKDEHDKDSHIRREDVTTIPSTSLTPDDIINQCRTMLTKL